MRYHFGRDHGRPFSMRNGDQATFDEPTPIHLPNEEPNGAVHDPAPRKGTGKRKRPKVNGVVDSRLEVQTNGDAMDIDVNGNTHVTNSVRAESETIMSEGESPSVADIPLSTLHIGHDAEIQTEKVADLMETTKFLSKPLKNVTVDHTIWGPPESKLLLTAGHTLLRFTHLPDDYTNGSNPDILTNFDIPLPLSQYEVTAVCWNSFSELAVAVKEQLTSDDEEVMKVNRLFKITDGGKDTQILSYSGGIVTTLRWNGPRNFLLAISMSDVVSSINIWKGDGEDPVWSSITESTIMDAIWTGEMSFIVCGTGFLQRYEIGEGLEQRIVLNRRTSFDTNEAWEQVKYDPVSGIIACATRQEGQSFLGVIHPRNPEKLELLEYPEPGLTDLSFQSLHRPGPVNSQLPVLLATGSKTGIARLYNVNDSENMFNCLERLGTVDEDNEGIHSVEFSPDGLHLATAGPDTLTIWNMENTEVPIGVWQCKAECEEWDPNADDEFKLGWDPDGSRVSIAFGSQV